MEKDWDVALDNNYKLIIVYPSLKIEVHCYYGETMPDLIDDSYFVITVNILNCWFKTLQQMIEHYSPIYAHKYNFIQQTWTSSIMSNKPIRDQYHRVSSILPEIIW